MTAGRTITRTIIPKVMTENGYPSINPDPWVEPVNEPPKIYQDATANYLMEEERRLFYVALTRAKQRLDILTVEGSKSQFIDELPDELCFHDHPLTEDELEEIRKKGEIRKKIRGTTEIAQDYPPMGTIKWNGRGHMKVNLFDASDEQQERFVEPKGQSMELTSCGIEFRSRPEEDAEGERLQLQIDKDTSMEVINE